VTARLIDNRYLIVGGRNTGTLHERQDDGSWTLIKDTRSGLSGIDSDGEGGLYVAGEFGWLERIDLATNEGNDESVAGVFDVLHSVLKTSSGTMLAAGGTFNQFPGPMQGTLLRLQK